MTNTSVPQFPSHKKGKGFLIGIVVFVVLGIFLIANIQKILFSILYILGALGLGPDMIDTN